MPRPRIFVTRAIPEDAAARLRTAAEVDFWEGELPPDPATLHARIRGIDGLLSMLTERIDAATLDAAGAQLKVVSNFAVGLDNVDLPEATRRRIPVGHTPGVLTETTADLAFALLLAAARRLPEGERYVKSGGWQTWAPIQLLGHEVHGATLGIVGMGRIGKAVARRARAFGMRVLYTNRSPAADPEGAEHRPLDALLEDSDFVTLHAPLTAQTRHLIDEAALRRMKRTAVLVNTARGPLVDSAALQRALSEGWIAAAALDVTDPEPLPSTHPLLRLENLLVVPHVGSATITTRARMAAIAVDNVLAGVEGRRLPHCANPEVYG